MLTAKEILYYSFSNISGLQLTVISSQKGIKKILLNEPLEDKTATHLQYDDPYFFGVFSQLKEYFDGKRKVFDVPIDLSGTIFQLKVWNELLKIPFGTTISYLKLAERIGDVKAIRAVGRANGANPVPIIVPCHRVINSDGSMGGYSAGLEIKIKLLEIEGCTSLQLFQE